MDQVVRPSDEEVAKEIRAVMDEFGFNFIEAREFVWAGYGVTDVRFTRPLTEEERRRIGVDIGPFELSPTQGHFIRSQAGVESAPVPVER